MDANQSRLDGQAVSRSTWECRAVPRASCECNAGAAPRQSVTTQGPLKRAYRGQRFGGGPICELLV